MIIIVIQQSQSDNSNSNREQNRSQLIIKIVKIIRHMVKQHHKFQQKSCRFVIIFFTIIISRSKIFSIETNAIFYLFESFQRRQEELERKAQDLERREEQLRNNSAGIRRNNWPPLPEQCCFQPCFYQDINVEIPPEFQRIVRHLYYLWGFYALVLTVNALVGLALLLFRGSDYFGHFTLGLIYGALFTPASFMCW